MPGAAFIARETVNCRRANTKKIIDLRDVGTYSAGHIL
jgi:hypothetical protein